MNESRQMIEASRLKQRITNMMLQQANINKDVIDLRRERNQGGGYQVRNIAGSFGSARFGSPCTGNCTVGA